MAQSRTVTTGAAREHSPVVPCLPSLLQSFCLPRSSSVISSPPGSFALSKSEPQFWIWANVLSLDAPLVAVMWQALLARALNVRLYALEPVVLALSVWLLYVVDHVFDAMRPAAAGWEPARRLFYRRHLHVMQCIALCVPAVVLWLARYFLNPEVFRVGFQIGCGVGSYFAVVHLAPERGRNAWPREAAVALLFAAGTFLPVWANSHSSMRPILVSALLFSILCWLNICAIETWEWNYSGERPEAMPHASTQWVTRHLRPFSVAICICSPLLLLAGLIPGAIAATASLSGIALCSLSGLRDRLSRAFLTSAADLALYSPCFFLVYLWAR
jgi:hypothetical protein